MDTGGPFGLGDPPDDFGTGEPDEQTRGWLPPEDRLWRHPSELGSARVAAASGTRYRPLGARWGAVAAGVVAAGVVAGISLSTTASQSTSNGTSTHPASGIDTSLVTAPAASAGALGTQPSVGPEAVKLADQQAASLVALVPSGSSASGARATGVVLPAKNLVATSAAAVAPGEHLWVIANDGRRHAGVVGGVDTKAGVAVIRLSDNLVPATFADEPVTARQVAMAACRCGSSTNGPAKPEVALGMVQAVGTDAVADGGASLVDAIEVVVPLGASPLGSVLIDDGGGVLGILAGASAVGDDTVGYFVPTSLVLAVAEELAHNGHVTHGWLGVVCQDASGVGAAVTIVLPSSPAEAAGIRPGDVVEAVDSHVVSSLADLQARLYAATPGTVLTLTMLRAGGVDTTSVTLVQAPS